jgi:hypothetical protein
MNDIDAARIADAIASNRYVYSNEADLQQGIAKALADAGLPAKREVRLSRQDVIDVMCGGVGVEVKVAGQRAKVERQLRRYATHPEVSELVLVTTRAAHRAVPAELDGKKVLVVWLSGGVQ